MKTTSVFVYALVCVGVIAGFSGCSQPVTIFDEALLIGKWQRPVTASDGTPGYDCYRYDADGNGVTWDTSDDVSEAEGQPFAWTLNGATLTLLHQGEMGQTVPKVYTLTLLTTSSLAYKDDYAKSYAFTKVN
ncbi:MAG: hypothetical protein LBS16_00335 [Prevotellaceae bacterium]|jgi:hypothetical protein|nr:hypothetical protein [Prevotellaceae bacterium]